MISIIPFQIYVTEKQTANKYLLKFRTCGVGSVVVSHMETWVQISLLTPSCFRSDQCVLLVKQQNSDRT